MSVCDYRINICCWLNHKYSDLYLSFLRSVSVVLRRLYYHKLLYALYIRHLLRHQCRACILNNFPQGFKCTLRCNRCTYRRRSVLQKICWYLWSLLASFPSASSFAYNSYALAEWNSVKQFLLKQCPHWIFIQIGNYSTTLQDCLNVSYVLCTKRKNYRNPRKIVFAPMPTLYWGIQGTSFWEEFIWVHTGPIYTPCGPLPSPLRLPS